MWRPITLVLFSLLLISAQRGSKRRNLRTLFEWKELEYNFPTEAERDSAIRGGLYVHGNGLPIDVDVHYGANDMSRVFVTVPRFITGIPFSLGTVTNKQGAGGPMLNAYPGYEWHSSHGQDCTGITSVFRVAIDECERLWILDTGRIGTVQHCNPQLLVFDLRKDILLNRYTFPQAQFKIGVSLYVTPIVDVRDPPPYGHCRNTMVYIADVTGFGILVYDFDTNSSWRLENKQMFPYPDYGTFTIAGESFDLMDGVLGLSISPKSMTGRPKSADDRNEATRNSRYYHNRVTTRSPTTSSPVEQERYLYFHALASAVENRIPLRIVDNRTIWTNHPESLPREFKIIGNRGTQSAAQAMDSQGNLYFGLMSDISIAAWNINTPYDRNNFRIVANNRDQLQFMSGLKVKRSRLNTEELWGLSCRFQKAFTGTKNSNEINFRIMGCNIDELLNSGCQARNDHRENLIFN